MPKPAALVVAVVLAAIPATGCSDPKTREIERLRAELEASKAEQARARAEADVLRDELVSARTETEIARAEVVRLGGKPAPAAPRRSESDHTPLEQRFTALKANYDKGAILSTEWSKLKAKVIEGIPDDVSAADKRTLGQRLIDLRLAYDAGAILSTEWTQAKAKLIAQKPGPGRPPAVLDRELDDLKKAYDAGAILSTEWTQAKAEVIKWAK